MLTLLLAPALALASPSGHYHPLDVGAASTAFGRAQEVAGTAFQKRQEQAQALAASLVAYEEALDLLGERATEAQRARQAALRKTFQRERAVLEAFAQDQLDGFDTAFSAALQRALAGRDLAECRVEAEGGLRMGPRMARPTPKACPGDDQNAALAARMDADKALARDLDVLLGATWPDLTFDRVPQPLLGGTGVGLDVRALFRDGAPDGLRAIDDADEEARLVFQAALEDDPSTEALTSMLDAARAVTARTSAFRAALAQPTLLAIEGLAAKAARKGAPQVGWCAQPDLLGGCDQPTADAELIRALTEHPKVLKALGDANRYRPPR